MSNVEAAKSDGKVSAGCREGEPATIQVDPESVIPVSVNKRGQRMHFTWEEAEAVGLQIWDLLGVYRPFKEIPVYRTPTEGGDADQVITVVPGEGSVAFVLPRESRSPCPCHRTRCVDLTFGALSDLTSELLIGLASTDDRAKIVDRLVGELESHQFERTNASFRYGRERHHALLIDLEVTAAAKHLQSWSAENKAALIEELREQVAAEAYASSGWPGIS